MTNINPFQMMSMMRKSGNPQQFMLNMLQQEMGNTPMGKNLIQLAQGGKTQQIEAIARNMVPDFDNQFAQFRNMLGI